MCVHHSFKFEFGGAGALIDPPGSLSLLDLLCLWTLLDQSVKPATPPEQLATAFATYNVVFCR